MLALSSTSLLKTQPPIIQNVREIWNTYTDFQLGNTYYQCLLGFQKLLSEAKSMPQQHILPAAPEEAYHSQTSSVTGLMLRPPQVQLKISREQFSLMQFYLYGQNLYGQQQESQQRRAATSTEILLRPDFPLETNCTIQEMSFLFRLWEMGSRAKLDCLV